MKRCPKCGCEEFYTNAHIVQGWLVDKDGYYIATSEECVCVAHDPDDDGMWECKRCGYSAAGEVFNVKENV